MHAIEEHAAVKGRVAANSIRSRRVWPDKPLPADAVGATWHSLFGRVISRCDVNRGLNDSEHEISKVEISEILSDDTGEHGGGVTTNIKLTCNSSFSFHTFASTVSASATIGAFCVTSTARELALRLSGESRLALTEAIRAHTTPSTLAKVTSKFGLGAAFKVVAFCVLAAVELTAIP